MKRWQTGLHLPYWAVALYSQNGTRWQLVGPYATKDNAIDCRAHTSCTTTWYYRQGAYAILQDYDTWYLVPGTSTGHSRTVNQYNGTGTMYHTMQGLRRVSHTIGWYQVVHTQHRAYGLHGVCDVQCSRKDDKLLLCMLEFAFCSFVLLFFIGLANENKRLSQDRIFDYRLPIGPMLAQQNVFST